MGSIDRDIAVIPMRALCAALVAFALPAGAEIFKCVDPAGRTTYQQSPCPSAAKGGVVQILIDNGRGTGSTPVGSTPPESAPLQPQRAEPSPSGENLEVGISKRRVERMLGPPNEVRRSDLQSDGASEIWVYGSSQAVTMRIGFIDSNVAWFKRAPPPGEAPPPSQP